MKTPIKQKIQIINEVVKALGSQFKCNSNQLKYQYFNFKELKNNLSVITVSFFQLHKLIRKILEIFKTQQTKQLILLYKIAFIMGNHCIAEVTIEDDDEVFAKSSIQASNLNHFFSQKYKMEVDEDHLQNLIDQIEPDFSVQFDLLKKKKRIRGATNFESVIYNKENNLIKLKPSLKQITHNSIFKREHSNKTVRWESQCYSSDSFKE